MGQNRRLYEEVSKQNELDKFQEFKSKKVTTTEEYNIYYK